MKTEKSYNHCTYCLEEFHSEKPFCPNCGKRNYKQDTIRSSFELNGDIAQLSIDDIINDEMQEEFR